MFWGEPWTAPWGAPENTLHHLTCERLPDGRTAVLHCTPASGYGGSYFELYVQDRMVAHFFAPENAATTVPVNLPASARFNSEPLGFALYPIGNWSFPPFSLRPVHLAATAADRGRRARLIWTATPLLSLSHGDNAAQLSSWSITGARRNRNLARVSTHATRGRLYWTLTNTGTTRTVTLYSDANGTHPVAAGSRVGDGALTLQPAGGSGLSATVTVAYSADIHAGAWLELRWPLRYDLFTNKGAGALDFTQPFAVIPDNGRDESFTWISAELAAGSWTFCLRPVTDTGVASANTAVHATLGVALPPEPPGMAVFSSGAAATGLTFHFSPSVTAGATYRLYRSAVPSGTPDTSAPDATAAAGATSIVSSLLTGGPGVYTFLLVALSASGESLNAETCACTLDAAGAVEATRPPPPLLVDPTVEQRTVTARVRFNPADASPGAAAVTAVDFYLVDESTTMDWTTPIASATPQPGLNGWQSAQTVLPAQATDGWYQLAARTHTAAGTRDTNTQVRWLYLSATVPSVPTPTALLIR